MASGLVDISLADHRATCPSTMRALSHIGTFAVMSSQPVVSGCSGSGGDRMPEDEWLDVVSAAEHHDCSTKTIWRRINQGVLPACTEKVSGRDGRPVIKTMIRVSDLNDVFGWTAHDEHVRKIREAATPLTAEQKEAILNVCLEHLLDRERSGGMPRSPDRRHRRKRRSRGDRGRPIARRRSNPRGDPDPTARGHDARASDPGGSGAAPNVRLSVTIRPSTRFRGRGSASHPDEDPDYAPR